MNETASSPVVRATGSSFYLAMRVLPRERREAMYAIYDFCRVVDDIADGSAAFAQRLLALENWRSKIGGIFSGRAPADLEALAQAVRRYGLRQEDFNSIIDGMAMDAAADIRAPEWTTLDLYCDRVASAVGRLSVRVFGLGEETSATLAHHLGRALQLTNILRDIDEDAAIGRLYIPHEALLRAGITADEPLSVAADPRLSGACLEIAERARAHFDEARRIMAGEPRAAVRAPRLMAAAYRSLLDNMVTRGFAPPRRRVRVSRLRMLGAILRHAIP
ncbi:MAG: presqualene diphosphate synthase HpnD [Hyphomicrobiales bacterium]|nr:presqualene diphosphate synthase HpnD [Hyphomicrobiales bacterium]